MKIVVAITINVASAWMVAKTIINTNFILCLTIFFFTYNIIGLSWYVLIYNNPFYIGFIYLFIHLKFLYRNLHT